MLDETLTFMLLGNRKMNDVAIEQMIMMLRVGIKIPQIYSSFVHTVGESLGIPCDHIAALVLHLDFMEIPMSLVLKRWSKNARSKVRRYVDKGPFCWDSMVTCRNWMLHDLCREMCVLASVREDQFATVTKKSNRRLGQQPSHEDDVDEDNYYTPNFGEEVDE
ncbi:hypothetical protein S245_052623, partial [Arachis hypogaea]